MSPPTLPVDEHGAHPLAGWEIERALHGMINVRSPALPPPTHPGIYVYNTRPAADTSSSVPGHWVGVCIPRGGRAEFFDSYGRHPSAYGNWTVDLMNGTGGSTWVYNNVPLQGIASFTCGHYVTAYCGFRFMGWSMEDYVDLFDPSTPRINDSIIVRLTLPMLKPSTY